MRRGPGLLQFGLENAGHPVLPAAGLPAMVAAAGCCLAAFARHALRSDPALDLRLFSIRTLRVSSLVGRASAGSG